MPRDCLLLRTARLLLLPDLLGTLFLLLLDPLLLWLLLSDPLLLGLLLLDPLLLWLLLLDPLLLGLLLLDPLLHLRALLLCRWRRTLLLPALLLFNLALFFVLLVALSVPRDNRPQKQKQGSGSGSSNEFHSDRPPLRSLSDMHVADQSASASVSPGQK